MNMCMSTFAHMHVHVHCVHVHGVCMVFAICVCARVRECALRRCRTTAVVVPLVGKVFERTG